MATAALASRNRCGKLPWLRGIQHSNLGSARLIIALAAGLLLALAFPKPGVAGLAWIGPGLLLAATLGVTGGRAFTLGYAGGAVFCLVSLRWLLEIPFPIGAAAGWLALAAYVGLYTGMWTWLAARLLGGRPPAPAPGDGIRERIRIAAARLTSLSWARRSVWALTCAAAWVALEMIQARLFSGFPWNLLGVSQYRVTPLIQIASVTGVYGVAFFIVWMSAALTCAGAKLIPPAGALAQGDSLPVPSLAPRPRPARRPLGKALGFALFTELALPLLALLLVSFTNGAGLVRPLPAAREIRLALIQPSIPQRLIFDPAESTNRFNTLMDLSRLALAAKPDVLVWPEASLPDFSRENLQALTNLIADHHTWLIFGADDADRRTLADGTPEYDFFNAAFLFNPRGDYADTYRKRRLVIFGEYVPLEKWLPFTKYLTPIQGSFRSGPGPVTFTVTEPLARIAPLICFEDVFPHGVPEHVRPDTDFLLNLTNDGWFGESSAHWQQAASAVFRAVENGLPLVRCTNNGLTCWIDAFGRMREVGIGDANNVYGAGFTIVRIPLLGPGERRAPTFYNRHGDVFGWTCLAVAGLALATTWRRQPAPAPAELRTAGPTR